MDITPRMPPAWRNIASWVAIAVVAAIVGYLLLSWMLGLPLHPRRLQDRKLAVEVLKIALGLAAGSGAVVALVLNYRRHRIEESQSHRDDQRLFTDRFQMATEQLGHERAAVRLAGVHALARLSDDWDQERQTCIDVLCAYLRLPPDAKPLQDIPAISTEDKIGDATHHPRIPQEEREIHQTIVRLIADHIRIDAEDEHRGVSWQGYSFDFTGVIFDGGAPIDFTGAKLSDGAMIFNGAEFSGAIVLFDHAEFSGARVSFLRARFSSGIISFEGAKFPTGWVNFNRTEFCGALVNFQDASFDGSHISFDRSVFSDGNVSFREAKFRRGRITFTSATFSDHARADFINVHFSGASISFAVAQFVGGQILFFRATFSGGRLDFLGAHLIGAKIHFPGATFSGATLDFHEVASWELPPTFDSWKTVPKGLLLPPAHFDQN
jgi:uncharacterized protein YjbI with pentapeptide repeats